MAAFSYGQETRDIQRTLMNKEKKEKQFYPDYLCEIVIVSFVLIEIVLVLAMLFPQPAGRRINFAAQYQPRPEWYFLWIFEILKYFSGRSAFIGAVIIPVFASLILVFLPFIDRGKKGRIKAVIAGTGLLLTFLVFTLISVFSD